MNFKETNMYTYNGENKEYHYATAIPYMRQVAFVASAANTVVTSDGYIPLLRDVIFNYKLVQMFTDIDMSQFDDDDDGIDIDTFIEFDNATGISELLKFWIDDEILDTLNTSVDDNIAYKTGIHKDNLSTAIVDFIKAATNKISTFGNDLNSEDVMDFIHKFEKAGISGENIVNTYLNSDSYKKNVADVIDSKNADIRNLKKKINDITAKNAVDDKHKNIVPIKK